MSSATAASRYKFHMRYQGKITNWKDDQGFGFITPNGGGKQVFVHIKSFSNRQQKPLDNEIVTYELKTDANGRVHAKNVAFVSDRKSATTSSERSYILPILTAAFLIFLAGSVSAGKLPFAVLGLYLATSTIAFGAYALDKSAAKNDRWRTQEITLHLFALIGGWPGALVAQRLLRHKSKKQSFQIIFLATVVINCCAIGWLFTNSGTKALHSIFGTS